MTDGRSPNKRVVELADAYETNWGDLTWSSWIALDAPLSVYQSHVTTAPGFYRIRSPKQAGIVYVGETGRNLRERTRSLAGGVSRDFGHPPWNDPHTAAPLLWAYRHENEFTYEVSVAEASIEKPQRKCHEDYLLYLHRIEHGHSTLANHGRLHPYWTRPTNKVGRRPPQRRDSPVKFPSLSPAVGSQDYLANDWLDLEWTRFQLLASVAVPNCAGVYRIRRGDDLLYCGQSLNLRSRVYTHRRDPRFESAEIALHVMPNPHPHQLLERETDLIGAFFGVIRRPPRHQYKPDS